MPAAAAMIESIYITLQHKDGDAEATRPEVVGKPNPYVIDLIMKEHNI